MRPTDFCHLNDLRVPVPRAFPLRSATFVAWISNGVLGSVDLPGDRVFHDTRERFGGSELGTRCHLASLLGAPFSVRELGAWASSSHGASQPIEPLTPLSPLPLARRSSEPPSRLLSALALTSLIAFFA